jgi:hypothetical protein
MIDIGPKPSTLVTAGSRRICLLTMTGGVNGVGRRKKTGLAKR